MSVRVLTQLLGPRYWLAAAGCSVLVALAIGIPTDVIPNPWFTRMTPVRTSDLVLLPLASISSGALLATYLGRGRTAKLPKAGLGASGLGYLAIGCPVCNKIVVGLMGFSGALNVFGPLQPWIGGLAVLLALVGLRLRTRALTQACVIPPPEPLPAQASV